MQEIKIWISEEVLYAQPRIRSGELHVQTSLIFEDANRSINLDLTTRPCDSRQKKKPWQIVDFAVPVDHRIKLKESIKISWELKWTIDVAVIPILTGALGTISEVLVKELEELEMRWQLEAIPNTALLISARILRRVLKTWGDLLSPYLPWKPSANTRVKKSLTINMTEKYHLKKAVKYKSI